MLATLCIGKMEVSYTLPRRKIRVSRKVTQQSDPQPFTIILASSLPNWGDDLGVVALIPHSKSIKIPYPQAPHHHNSTLEGREQLPLLLPLNLMLRYAQPCWIAEIIYGFV